MAGSEAEKLRGGSSKILWQAGESFRPELITGVLIVEHRSIDNPVNGIGFEWWPGMFGSRVQIYPKTSIAIIEYHDSSAQRHHEFPINTIKTHGTRKGTAISLIATMGDRKDFVTLLPTGEIEIKYHRTKSPLKKRVLNQESLLRDFRQEIDLTIEEAAALVGRTPSTIAELCRKGRISARMRGRQWAVDKESLAAYYQRSR